MSLVSVILPCYNEGKNVTRAHQVIVRLFDQNHIDFELLFVNDGSKDDTWEEISRISESDSRVRGINFSRNFGKESALFAGLSYAKGDCCITIDCDLQHPPETMIDMYRLWQQGYEVVEGVKKSRGKESFIHKLSVKCFYSLLNKATKFDMSKASDFKLLDRKAVNILLTMPERQMFYRALSHWIGFQKTAVEFEVQERQEGETKWSTWSLVKYAVSNITSFSAAPMQIVTALGCIFLILALVVGIISVIRYVTGHSLEGFTTVILLLLILGAALMMSLGIMGYYIAKIYEEVKGRPRFIVEEFAGKESNEQ